MKPRSHALKDGRTLLIRKAQPEDARSVLEYVERASGESDFLTFGPGELGLSETDEENVLRRYHDSDNQLFILGLIDGAVIATLSFAAGQRPRVRHCGEFGMSVRKDHWGQGIGAYMIDALIEWARASGIVKKIDLRVRTDNERAIMLYRNKGFVIEGTISRGMFTGEAYHDLHWMGLEL